MVATSAKPTQSNRHQMMLRKPQTMQPRQEAAIIQMTDLQLLNSHAGIDTASKQDSAQTVR
jgi:hypothetical protein